MNNTRFINSSLPFSYSLLTKNIPYLTTSNTPSTTELLDWIPSSEVYPLAQGVYIEDNNGVSGTPNVLQYDVDSGIGDIFSTECTLLCRLHLPLEKLNTPYRYDIAGGSPTSGRNFYLGYYGGLNTNTSLQNHFQFTFKGSVGERITINLPHTEGNNITVCARKRADNSIVFSVTDNDTLMTTSLVDNNPTNVLLNNIADFAICNGGTSKTLSSSQSRRFIGGINSFYIYNSYLEDQELLSVSSGEEIGDYLGYNSLMARTFQENLNSAELLPVASGYTDTTTSVTVYKVGDPTRPLGSINRQSEGSYIQMKPLQDGDVFAKRKGEGYHRILVEGICSNNITSLKVRLVSPVEYSSWQSINVIGGVFSSELNTITKSEWLYIEVSDEDETLVTRQPTRIGAGYVIYAPNQSQFRIMSTSDSDQNIDTLSAGVKAAMIIDDDPNYGGKWKHYIYQEGCPIPDGIAAFFNYVHSLVNAPILMLNDAQSGTGVTQMLDDNDLNRDWQHTVDCINSKRDNTIDCVAWCWYTNDQTLGSDYPLLFDAVLYNEGVYKSPQDHFFGEIFREGYNFMVMPATRAIDSSNGPYDYDFGNASGNIDAVRRIQRTWCDDKDFAIAGPETTDMAIKDGNFYGPHENRDIKQGTWRLGYRTGIGVARMLGFDMSSDPSLSNYTINPSRDTIIVTPDLPNIGSTLKTNGYDSDVFGFEISEDSGTTWSRSGFSAQIQSSTVVIVKTSGVWSPSLQIRYCYGGPLSYGGVVEEQDTPYDHLLYDGSSYEDGLGLPLIPSEVVII